MTTSSTKAKGTISPEGFSYYSAFEKNTKTIRFDPPLVLWSHNFHPKSDVEPDYEADPFRYLVSPVEVVALTRTRVTYLCYNRWSKQWCTETRSYHRLNFYPTQREALIAASLSIARGAQGDAQRLLGSVKKIDMARKCLNVISAYHVLHTDLVNLRCTLSETRDLLS